MLPPVSHALGRLLSPTFPKGLIAGALRRLEHPEGRLSVWRLVLQIEKAGDQWRRARRLDPELEGVEEKIRKYGSATTE